MSIDIIKPNAEGVIVPSKVIQALDNVKEALSKKHDSDVKLLRAVVRLYVECKHADVRLKGVDVVQYTGASAGYISQVWRSCDEAWKRKREALTGEANKLGFRPFVKRYLPKPGHSRVREAAPSKIVDTVEELKAYIMESLENLTPAQKKSIFLDLSFMVTEVSKEIPADVRKSAKRHAVK